MDAQAANPPAPPTTRRQRILTVAQRALRQFGLEKASLRLLKHTTTALFRVDADARFVLRVHPPNRHTVELLRSELILLTMLRRDTDLLVPEPVAAQNGQYLVTAEVDSTLGDYHCALFRRLPGRHKPRSLTTADAYRIGRALGAFHHYTSQFAPPPDFVRWDFDAATFVDAVAPIEHYGARVLQPVDRLMLSRAVARAQTAIQTARRRADMLGLIHADTNLSNFLFTRDSVAMLDFEVCCYGYYLFDVGRLLHEFLDYGPYAPALSDAFFGGYTAIRALPPLDDQRVTAFALMSLTDTVGWLLAMEPPLQAAWQRRLLETTLHKIRFLM